MSISSIAAPEPEKPKEETAPLDASAATAEPTTPTTEASVAPAATAPNTPVTNTAEAKPNPPVTTNSAVSQADAITQALLAQIAPVGVKANFKILIYGPPGSTKSSFLAGADNQLVFDQEDGLISIKTQEEHTGRPAKPNIRSIPFSSFGAADALVDRLAARIPELDWVKVFSIDTYNDFYRKALSERVIKRWEQRPSSVDKYVASQDENDYSAVNEQMVRFARKLRDLDRDIIILAHEKTVEPKGKPSKTYPDFSEGLANKIEAMMDIVGYMEFKEIDGKMVPVLRVKTDGIVHAKSRIPLPDVILNPSFDAIRAQWEKVING